MTFNSKAKNIAGGIAAFFVVLHLCFVITGTTYIYKAVWYNLANIDDYKIFHNREIPPSPQPQPWPVAKTSYTFNDSLSSYLEKIETKAVLVLRNDTIIYERYDDNYSEKSISNSFSVAKSFVSALIGIAIREGKIKSVDEKVGAFLPEFSRGEKSEITIRHLLTMSSGLNWDESYAAPISTTTEAYYGTDLKKLIDKLEVSEPPGKIFRYKSSDTQILSMVLAKATGKSLSENLAGLWAALGAEQQALWSLDHKDGLEKAYCCIYSNARDFARLGSLYLHNGKWKGTTVIDSSYIAESLTPCNLPDGDLSMGSSDFYGYQWWMIPDKKLFYARGILGQYIIVLPDKNMVIVRLGANRGDKIGKHYKESIMLADEVRRWD